MLLDRRRRDMYPVPWSRISHDMPCEKRTHEKDSHFKQIFDDSEPPNLNRDLTHQNYCLNGVLLHHSLT